MPQNYIKQASKILCIGRNYHAHIAELQNAKPSQPFYFLKPPSSILYPDGTAAKPQVYHGHQEHQGHWDHLGHRGNTSYPSVLIPRGTVVHHEVELAVILNKQLRNVDPDSFTAQQADGCIAGYAVGIDFTARNVQDEAKRKGLPWTIGKGFDTFLPLSRFIPRDAIRDPYDVELWFKLNGVEKQRDLASLMIFPIHKILSTMSCVMTLEKGDIILTGTPKGVGPVKPGDFIEAGININGNEVMEGRLNLMVEEKPGPYEYKET